MVKMVMRHLTLFAGVLAASLGVYYGVGTMGGLDAGTVQAGPFSADGISGAYRLSDLRILDRTRFFVKERYVAPERIDPEQMFSRALDKVEREVDSVLLRREPGGRMLHVSVGAYTTTLQLEPMETMDDLRRALGQVALVLDEHLDGEDVDLSEVEYAMVNGMLSTLDPHSILMPPQVASDMETENQGEFGGLGITITMRRGRLTVEYPLEGTPAWKVGIEPGDQIIRIEDESTINMDLTEAVSKLRGPPGAPVTITVMRELFDEPQPFTIVREIIQYNPVEGQLLDGDIGYVRIRSFHKKTSQDLDAALAAFRQELGGPPEGLILDLRDNAGGFLNQAVEVTDRFISRGQVVATVAANGQREVDQARSGLTEPDYPMVVLTSAHSASASEIVAGALRNHERATVIGERTFGKGSVQHLYDNPDDSQLKLTVAQYLTPGDESIQSVGITPDVELLPLVVEHDPARLEEARARVRRQEPETSEDKGPPEPRVTLLWRKRVAREADLERHLTWEAPRPSETPAYRLSYLRDLVADIENQRREKRDLTRDWEVQFARDVILGAKGSRRADLVLAASKVVAERARQEEERVVSAFRELGIDWTPGPQPDKVALNLSLDLGEEGFLQAGQQGQVTVSVTNEGDRPVHQLMALARASNDLDGLEFFFGRVEPGETRSYSRKVELAAGYADEVDLVRFALLDGAGNMLGRKDQLFRSKGQDLPRLAYRFTLHDDGSGRSRGNGDGVPQPGEVVDMEVHVVNEGEVDAGLVFARVKRMEGKELDLQVGTLELGAPGPGEEVSGRFTFEVRPSWDGTFPVLEFQVGDDRLYDYAVVMRAGFYDYVTQKERLELPVFHDAQAELPPEVRDLGRLRRPPSLELTRVPDLVTADGDMVVSGVVRDDQGVQDIIVFHTWMEPVDELDGQTLFQSGHVSRPGEEKIYYRGGDGGVEALPFSVERDLEPGLNTFIILGHDVEGLTLGRSVNVFYDANGLVVQAEQ